MAIKPTRTKFQLHYGLWYARYGWPIEPVFEAKDGYCTCKEGRGCSHAGRHPRTKHGVHDATTNPEQIKRWWTQWPDANIGLATGRISEIIVIDVDPRNGGLKTLRALLKELGPLPKTITARSGGGGIHFFFKYPDFQVRSDLQGELLGPGVDVLSDNSLLVLPYSRHEFGIVVLVVHWAIFCQNESRKSARALATAATPAHRCSRASSPRRRRC